MRIRKMSSDGDYIFGHGSNDFYINTPDAVAQAIKTKLLLFAGEWFLDTNYGMPWGGIPINNLVVSQGKVLGKGSRLADFAIKTCILNTQGVLTISNYFSSVDVNRKLKVNVTVTTIYGNVDILIDQKTDYTFTIGVTPLDSDIPLG